VLSMACLRVPDTPSSSRLDAISTAALAWAHVVINAGRADAMPEVLTAPRVITGGETVRLAQR
jgi:hypothetical protein